MFSLVRLRPTTRRVAIVSACLGVTLIAASGTWAYVNANQANADRTTATRANQNLANDISTSVTSLIRQDSDLLRTLSREPSFGEWQTLPGTNEHKLSDTTSEGPGFRNEMRTAFIDYKTLFPSSFESLEFIDTEANQPIALMTKDGWVPQSDLRKAIDKTQEGLVGSASVIPAGTTLVTAPYTGAGGEQIISVAGPLLAGGTHGLVVATINVTRLQDALIAAGGPVGSISGIVDRGNDSILATGTGHYALPQSVAKTGVKRLNASPDAQSYLTGNNVVSLSPAARATANGISLNWLGVVTESPLPTSGLAAAMQPGIIALALTGLALLVLTFVLALRIRRRDARQAALVRLERDRFANGMVELTEALARTSTGDLATRLNVELGDEAMTGLAASFDQTLAALRELVSQAQMNSSLLNAAATELRASSTQQATSANQQSAVVTETTATIEELAATAVQIAENSEAVAAVAEQTLSTTMEGRAAVEESVAAIEAVNSQVGFIAQACEGLGEKIAEIGGILAIIDELSDQTNLLALNAAIEAARAGEHGRGFAVVATEIRRLAERSQESTVRIQSIITEISSRARQTVDASAQGSHAVHAVTEQARNAADSLERIASLVDTTTSAAREISSATGQQRSASEQVVQAMAEVSASARQFAAGAKQSAVSAQEIADLAVRTEMSISHFVTEQTEDQMDSPSADHDAAELAESVS
jgi:methyl-accepting chemotaxis protein